MLFRSDPEVDTIFVLSDGQPSSGDYLEDVNFHRGINRDNEFRKVMIHTVLTGTKGTDAKFMERLAGDTNGISVKR